MKKIKVIKSLLVGSAYREVNSIFEIADDIAADLVKSGHAVFYNGEPVKPEPKPEVKPEQATAQPKTETAEAKPQPKPEPKPEPEPKPKPEVKKEDKPKA